MTDDRQVRHEGDEAMRCGGCGSRNMMTTQADDCLHGICMDCRRVQEVETRDWPEAKMCDNCAFRKGSGERADPYRWAEIQEVLASGQYFHCHKGLPLNPKSGQFTAPDRGAGRLTVCAGFLASLAARLRRDEMAETADA